MELKENTIQSSKSLRGIAMVVFALGVLIGTIFIVIGVGTVSAGFSTSLKNTSFIQCVVFIAIGIFVFINSYVLYVIISAFATMVENSDRTDVVNALNSINGTLQTMKLQQHSNNINSAVED